MRVRAAVLPFALLVILTTGWPDARADAPLWEAGVGLAGLRLPDYRGASQSHSWVLPLPYVVYRGEVFRANREGVRAVLFNSSSVDLDLSVSASSPTRSKDNVARAGMPDLAPLLEFGPNVKVRLDSGSGGQWELRAPLRAVFSLQSHLREQGWTFSPHLNVDFKVAGWDLGAQAGPIFGSRALHAYYYDVSAQQVAAGRPEYHSAGGAGGWRIAAAASRQVGDIWMGAFVRGDSVSGARFASSPLVRQNYNISVGFGISWIIARAGQRVSTP